MPPAEESPLTRLRALRPPGRPDTIVLAIGGPITRADLPALCDQVCVLLEDCEVETIVCDLDPLVLPDAVTVDAVARLQLTARRLGGRVRLGRAQDALRELLGLCGLGDIVPYCGDLSLEPGGEAEQGEDGRRIEEKGNPSDPSAR